MTRLIAWIVSKFPEWTALLRKIPWNAIWTKPHRLRNALIVCAVLISLWSLWSAGETVSVPSESSGPLASTATMSLFGEERLDSEDILNLRHCFAKAKLDDYTLESGRVLIPSHRVSAYLDSLQQSKWKPTGSQERLEQALQRASSPMLTSDLRSKRLQLAEQERLGRQIETFDGIAEAIVSYEVENNSGFARGKTARAAVMIRNQPDSTLSVERAAAILDYVLCSVSGLKPENVVLIDRDTNRRFLGENLRQASLELDPRTLYRLAQEERLEKILASELASLGEPEIRIAVTAVPQVTPRLPMTATPDIAGSANAAANSGTNMNAASHDRGLAIPDAGHHVGYTPADCLAVPMAPDGSNRTSSSDFLGNTTNHGTSAGDMASEADVTSGMIGTLDITEVTTGVAAIAAPLTDLPSQNGSLESVRSVYPVDSTNPVDRAIPAGPINPVDSAYTGDPKDSMAADVSSSTALQANRPVALPECLTPMGNRIEGGSDGNISTDGNSIPMDSDTTSADSAARLPAFDASVASDLPLSNLPASSVSSLPSSETSTSPRFLESQNELQPVSPLQLVPQPRSSSASLPAVLPNDVRVLPRDHRVVETAMRSESRDESPSEWSFAVSIEIPSRWFVQRWNRHRTQMFEEATTQDAFNLFRRRELSSIAQRLQQVVPAEFTCDLSVTELDDGPSEMLSEMTAPNTNLPWLAILCGTLLLVWVGYRSILSRYFSPSPCLAAPNTSAMSAQPVPSWESASVSQTPRTRPFAGHVVTSTYGRAASVPTQDSAFEPNCHAMDETFGAKSSANHSLLPSGNSKNSANPENLAEDFSENLENDAEVPTDMDALDADEPVLRQEIRQAILRDPVHASAVLRSWLGEVHLDDNSITH